MLNTCLLKEMFVTWQALMALMVIIAPFSNGFQVRLTHLSTIWMPQSFDGDNPQFGFPTLSVEQLTFEPTAKLIYAVGESIIQVVDATNPRQLRYVSHVIVPYVDMTDVEVCGRNLFVSYRNLTDLSQGGLLVFELYSPTRSMNQLHNIPLGSLPDMVWPTKDCTIVVAIENEAVTINGELFDPPGGVGIVRFPQGVENTPEVTLLDFSKFDDQFDLLSRSGVRWVYRGSGNFSNNVEPEYITLNADHTLAYVTLQENNAVAEVNLVTGNITAIYGLGFKKWGNLDPSDRDGGIHIYNWPVYSMYLPDALDFVHWNGQDYVITANEGDSQEYGVVGFQEEKRGNQFTATELDPTVTPDLRQALHDNAKLGRLTFSGVDGKNERDLFDKFYTYGGRSFSIWLLPDMTQVFDSGDELERRLAELRSDLFNGDMSDVDDLVSEDFDSRSDNKGPETESLAVGVLDGRLLIFVGNERPGTIAVYSVESGNHMQPRFESLFADNIPKGNNSWGQLYEERQVYALDPEFISFFHPDTGLADVPVLLVGGAVSGTISLLQVEIINP